MSAIYIRERVRLLIPTPPSGPWANNTHPTAPFDVKDYKELNVKKYASPSDCKDCLTCDLHFETKKRQKYDCIAYSGHISAENAQSCVSDLIRSVEENHEYLQGKLQSHGDNLLKRWPKLDKSGRQKRFNNIGLEQKAWPQLARYYQYDWGWHEKRQYRNAFLIPHLNLESLSRSDARLLRLLHNRTIHKPADYFWDDLRSIQFPLSTGLLEKKFNSGCMVTDGEQRGMLVPFDKARLHREEICGFPVAQLVLEAQNLLMRKLRAIVDELVKDLATGSGNNKWKEAATNDFRSMDPNTADARLKYAILEQPYGPPQRFAIPELLDMIQLRSDILADELKDLQQDPTYLQATLLEIDGRRRMLEKDKEDPEAAIWWTQAAKNIWIWDYSRAIDWSELRVVLSTDISRHKATATNSNKASPPDLALGQDLPGEYTEALSKFCRRITCAFYHWIVPQAEDCLRQFPGVIKSPFTLYSGLRPFELHAEYMSFGGRRRLFTKDRLLWALLEMFYSMEIDNALQVGMILGILAEEVQRRDQQARLSPKILLLIDDLMSLYMLWRATISLRPAFPKIQHADSNTKAIFTLTLTTYDKGIVAERASRQLTMSIEELGPEFLNTREDHPPAALVLAWQAKWPKGQVNQGWLHRAENARYKLYKFWETWRKSMHRAIRRTWPGLGPEAPEKGSILFDLLDHDLRSDHFEMIEAEETAIWERIDRATHPRKRKSDDDKRNSTQPVEPRTQIPHSATPGPEGRFEAPTSKKKQKTTGEAARPAEPVAQPEPIPAQASPDLPKTLVSKKSYEVLERMFPVESGNYKEGTIRFKDVEGVLAEAGLAIEQGQGSAVVFKQEADKEQGKPSARISLHRPHRDGDNVDSYILRIMGRRLNNRLGWKLKRFEVKKGGR